MLKIARKENELKKLTRITCYSRYSCCWNKDTGNTGTQGNRPPFNKGKFGNKPGAKPFEKPVISEKDIEKELKETLARLSNTGGKSKGSKNRRAKRDVYAQRREQEMLDAESQEKIIKLSEFVSVSELASMMNVSPTQVISACMSLGIFASINQTIRC
jgi:translation initiation factor IF-2